MKVFLWALWQGDDGFHCSEVLKILKNGSFLVIWDHIRFEGLCKRPIEARKARLSLRRWGGWEFSPKR